MLSFSPAIKLWYCPDPVDMRLGFDGLFALVQEPSTGRPAVRPPLHIPQSHRRPPQGSLLGGHGLCLWLPTPRSGSLSLPDPSATATAIELTACQFQMILDGIDLGKARRFKRFFASLSEKGRYLSAVACLNVAWTPPCLPQTLPCPTTATLQGMVRELLTEVARLRTENAD